LVTKGRYLFLDEALRSYEPFLNTGLVDVILIDNGADEKSSKLLLDWKNRFPHLVRYFRKNENEPAGTPYFWEKIKSFKPDWIVFPGDDDELVFDVFESFIATLKNTPEISAYASSAEIINIDGKKSGLIRQPAIHGLISKTEKLSKSLHEPPFLWPGLFFKFDLIKQEVPNSRFVFDWWVGLQLVLGGVVLTTSDVGVRYRAHSFQESNQTPSRRKYLEGFHMIADFINSKEFLKAIKSMPSSEVINFLELSFVAKPLYSQPEYTVQLLNDVVLNTLEFIESLDLRTQALEKYLFASGILLKRTDLNNFYINSNLEFDKSQGNVAIKFSTNTCSNLMNSSLLFNQNSTNRYIIACKHSTHSTGSIEVNCDRLVGSSVAEIADAVLLAINTSLEKNGYLAFSTTPFEKSIITKIRQIKSRMPKVIMKNSAFIKKILSN
jgi:hypothetical protein